MQRHVQCKLQKGNTFQTAWIPRKFAILDKYVKLKDDNGWRVIEVYRPLPSSKIPLIRDIFRHHRKVTDI